MPPATAPDGFESDPSVRALLADLLKLAGGGYRDQERGAFLVTGEDGRYRCLVWPMDGSFWREEFRGAFPPNTVAVLHTHPNALPLPSPGDRAEARRLRLPFTVVTRQNIYTVAPDGRVREVVRNRLWITRIDRDRRERCEKFPRLTLDLDSSDLHR